MPSKAAEKQKQSQKKKVVELDFASLDPQEFAKLAAAFNKEKRFRQEESREGEIDKDADADAEEMGSGLEYDGDGNLIEADDDDEVLDDGQADKSCECWLPTSDFSVTQLSSGSPLTLYLF
jgi:hypothetical protein